MSSETGNAQARKENWGSGNPNLELQKQETHNPNHSDSVIERTAKAEITQKPLAAPGTNDGAKVGKLGAACSERIGRELISDSSCWNGADCHSGSSSATRLNSPARLRQPPFCV